ncbi:MAG: 1,2-phenylacetyl-CoA epoxidase subunit PaaC [Candidatus Limnocylindria bacterium]
MSVRDTSQQATAELLLTLADDEFVLGFWDSEWTGIAPMLEEDVATSSIAQDEIGHAKAWYELLAELTDDDADRIAFGREPEAYRHAALMNHPRTDWAFTVVRRFLYETADAVRLEALSRSSLAEIAGLAAKMRREETYHLLHWSAWMRRLAAGAETRERVVAALERAWPDAEAIFSPLAGESALLADGILPDSLATLRAAWHDRTAAELSATGLPVPAGDAPPPIEGRTQPTDDFRWLWGEFTSVARADPGATW